MKTTANQDMLISEAKEIVGILMESAFYLELPLEERCILVKSIIAAR